MMSRYMIPLQTNQSEIVASAQIKDTSIPWKITVPFDEQNHLFYQTVQTDYSIDGYICSCGEQKLILRHHNQEEQFVCELCGNEIFYDAIYALDHVEHFSFVHFEVNLYKSYEIKVSDDGLAAYCMITLPCNIDYAREKIIYTQRSIYSLSFDDSGNLVEKYALPKHDQMFTILENLILERVLELNTLDVHIPKEIKLSLQMISYFLTYKRLKVFDFYYWADIEILQDKNITIEDALTQISNYRREKSVKKAVYHNYLNQLVEHKKFYWQYIDLFTKHIKDVNIVCRLINLRICQDILKFTNKDTMEQFFLFLKKYYTEWQIFGLMDSISASTHIIYVDMLNEFVFDPIGIEKQFSKVPCTLHSLHTEFVCCTEKKRILENCKIKFQYSYFSNFYESACGKFGDYIVKLPYTGQELKKWADVLQNCMFSYTKQIQSNDTYIYGFFLNDILQFAVEIYCRSLIQASAIDNSDLSNTQEKLLFAWLDKHFTQIN